MGGMLVSALVKAIDWQVEYRPREWSQGRGKSKLFVFVNKEEAFYLAASLKGQDNEVWEVEAEDISPLFAGLPFYGDAAAIREFWEEGRLDRRVYATTLPMDGTLLAGKVRLVRKLKLPA
jgi:hypothetical protein